MALLQAFQPWQIFIKNKNIWNYGEDKINQGRLRKVCVRAVFLVSPDPAVRDGGEHDLGRVRSRHWSWQQSCQQDFAKFSQCSSLCLQQLHQIGSLFGKNVNFSQCSQYKVHITYLSMGRTIKIVLDQGAHCAEDLIFEISTLQIVQLGWAGR